MHGEHAVNAAAAAAAGQPDSLSMRVSSIHQCAALLASLQAPNKHQST
jgi:hypothetical protein